MNKTMAEINAERQRQIVRGWTPQHDDTHTIGETIHAEAWSSQARLQDAKQTILSTITQRAYLVQAAAMIVVEVERIDRAALASELPHG